MAALLYAVLSLLMFAPGMVPGRTLSPSDYLWSATPWESLRPPTVPLLGSNREQADAVTMFEPWLEYTRSQLPHIPLWNPYAMGGRPYQANSQTAVFSPFSVPAYVLGLNAGRAFMAALKVFVAALGTFVLARLLGMRFRGALLAGLVFGFSLWCVTWVAWTTMSVWALLPWLLAAGEMVLRRPGPLPFAALATVVGLQFYAGHPATSFQVLVPAFAFWVLRLALGRPFDRRRVILRVLVLAGAVSTGTALAAALLIPFVELLSSSIDLKERTGSVGHLPSRYLVGIFLPDFWGRSTRGTLIEYPSALEERAFYIGALPLMLCVAALVLRPTRARVFAAAIVPIALGVAAGIPPFFTIVSHLPGFNGTNTWRLAVFAVLAAALLSGWGLQDLLDAKIGQRRRALTLAAAIALLVLPMAIVAGTGTLRSGQLGEAIRLAWGFAHPPAELATGDRAAFVHVVRLSALLEWVPFALAGVVVIGLGLRRRVAAPALLALVVVLSAADLFRAGMGYNPAIPEAHAEQPTTEAIRFLQSQRPARFAGIDPKVRFTTPLPPNVAVRYDLYDARGYDLPVERRYAELWRSSVAATRDCNYAFCTTSVFPRPEALRVLGILGVEHLLQKRDDPLLRGLPVVYEGPDARIYRNPHAVPRAFVVGAQTVAATAADSLAAVTSPASSPRTVAVTERPLPGLALRGAGAGTDRNVGDARITRYEPEHVAIRARTTRSALLVLTDTWFPGWSATVDGRPATIHRVDHLLRGVQVPGGDHRVEFRYEPRSWRAGWVITLMASAVILAASIIGIRRRSLRRRRGPGGA